MQLRVVKGESLLYFGNAPYQTLIPPGFKSFVQTSLMQPKAGAARERNPRSFPNEPRQNPERVRDKESHCLNVERVANLLIYIFIIYKQENS